MFTKKALMTKWSLYTGALLALILLQQLVLDQLTLWGVVPFLMPMTVAVAAALEGPVPGTLFGIFVGFLCDLAGGGVFSGVYTLSFFLIALFVAILAKYWVMRSVFGSLIWALLAFGVIDAVQILFLAVFHRADPLIALSLAGREAAVSLLFVIPIFLLFNYLHRLFRYE